MCGPVGMYNFLDKQIQTLNLERKWIRHELQGEVHNPKSLPDYPSGIEVAKQVEIMVHICDNVYKIKADSEDTILQSLEKMELQLRHIVVPVNVDGVIHCL